jgi:exonuclease VII small subunit
MSEKSKTLKELLVEFDSVVAWFDAMNEEFDVDKTIEQYKKGASLAGEIKKRLEKAKNEIEVVTKNGTDL